MKFWQNYLTGKALSSFVVVKGQSSISADAGCTVTHSGYEVGAKRMLTVLSDSRGGVI